MKKIMKNKKYLHKTYKINFSEYNDVHKPYLREEEIIKKYEKQGYELLSVVSTPPMELIDSNYFNFDMHYYFKKEIIEE